MCGIAGMYELGGGSPDRRILERMTGLLAHRGPDDAGHYIAGRIGLGHRRLSIIDLSEGGHQPMSNDDGSLWITYNGECYNYRELARELRAAGVSLRTQSDTEVLLRLYERDGERFLERVDGMFALAIWDSRRQSLFLARDRIGVKPLYYYAGPRRFTFASEMKALLADPALPLEIDRGALGDYLYFLSIPDPRSILKGLRKLLPGHYLKVTPEGFLEKRYWDVRIAPRADMSIDEACQQFEGRFRAAVEAHMVADVPVGAFLSGGVDSSSVVAVAQLAAGSPLQSFSITFPGLAEFDESAFAAQAAAHSGARHREFPLTPNLVNALPRIAWHADEPFAISSAFALYFLAQHAREHVKVVLSGDGADELFAGYVWRHSDFADLSRLQRIPALRAAASMPAVRALQKRLPAGVRWRLPGLQGDAERFVQSFACYKRHEIDELLLPSCRREVISSWESNIVQRYLDSAAPGEQLAGKLYAEMKTTLVSEMLTKLDRMTMAHGLEARVPFLDHHLVEWAFTVPAQHKLQGREGKLLVKRAMAKYVPRANLYRPKQGFNVPLKPWLRAELKEFIRDQLAPERIARRGLLRPERVSALLDAHFSGKAEASNRIFALLMLDLWMQHFVDARASFLPS